MSQAMPSSTTSLARSFTGLIRRAGLRSAAAPSSQGALRLRSGADMPVGTPAARTSELDENKELSRNDGSPRPENNKFLLGEFSRCFQQCVLSGCIPSWWVRSSSPKPGKAGLMDHFAAWYEAQLTKYDEGTRALKSEAVIDEFAKHELPFPNPLFTDVWLPFARAVRYCDDEDVVAFQADPSMTLKRNIAIDRYSYAIPSYSAISKMLEHGTDVIEFGSGSGYWAGLLSQAGASVTAIDRRTQAVPWFPDTVFADGVEYLKEHDGLPGKTLFICWPAEDLDLNPVLDAFRGDTVVWIGEEDGGCTAQVWSADWEELERFRIPTWPLLHDLMVIYKRRSSTV